MPREDLPEPFNCPECGADDVIVNADALIWLSKEELVEGCHFWLAHDSRWFCEACREGGEVTDMGADPGPNTGETDEDYESRRHFRRVALELLPMLNSRGLLGDGVDVWLRRINEAPLSLLLGIIIELQNRLNLPAPEEPSYDSTPGVT